MPTPDLTKTALTSFLVRFVTNSALDISSIVSQNVTTIAFASQIVVATNPSALMHVHAMPIALTDVKSANTLYVLNAMTSIQMKIIKNAKDRDLPIVVRAIQRDHPDLLRQNCFKSLE